MVHFLLLAGSFFIIGSGIGSFSGVLMETTIKRSFWMGRSQCLTCKEKLRWYELIPVISYIIQRGRCRMCRSIIPSWVFSIEVLMGLVWMVFGTVFIIHGYSIWVIGSHLILLSMILMLAIEDMKSGTIPDRLSLPMILITVVILIFSWRTLEGGLLPGIRYAFLGGIAGMIFYLLQMMIPAISSIMRKKLYTEALHIAMVPLFFPFWLIIKAIFGEKKADAWISSISITDDLPTWVGGGDVRLGILVGLIAGPLYFWWIIGIGYTLGTIFWLMYRFTHKGKMEILPVAPLLYLGTGLLWVMEYVLI